MLFLIIAVIIGFLFGWFDRDYCFSLLCSMVGFFLGIFLWVSIGGLIGYILPMVDVVEEQEIYALDDSTNINGVNYLFYGYIDED